MKANCSKSYRFTRSTFSSKKRKNPFLELNRAVHCVDVHRARWSLGSHVSACEEGPEPFENVPVVCVLGDLERGLDMPATCGSRQFVAVNGNREASFTIHEPHDPSRVECIESGFLLIVRTDRIFTVHVLDPTERA